MFVSVKEQTQLIGIQKALGAKRYFILLQFLFEAIILSLIGGILGLIFVFAGVKIFTSMYDMEIFMSTGNVITGLILSISIGIISGFVPAMQASKLDPVVAISTV
jgi:putative ABC transport system permease protein